jgi:nickel/cobalt transporter (NicO) family protein
MENVLAIALTMLIDIQRQIYSSLSGYLTAFAANRDWAALLGLLPAGVLFGAVHALTPGHGKSVLAAYLLGSRLQALRATAVAGVLSLTHVGSAVILALLAAPLVTRTLGGVGRAPALELFSRGILVAIGLWLLLRAVRGRRHVHGEGVAVGFVAGLVPCPLTLFAMFLALGRGVPEAGLMFALAMMLGVALTLSGIALLTILARDAVVGLMARHGASLERLARILDGLGGVLLIVFAAREIWR